MQNGTLSHPFLRLGTVIHGLRILKEHTMKLRVLPSADSSVIPTTTGTLLHRGAMQPPRRRTAPDFPQTQAGTPLRVSHKPGTVQTGYRQLQAVTT